MGGEGEGRVENSSDKSVREEKESVDVISPPSSRVAPRHVMGGPSPVVVRAKTLKM